MKNTKSIKDLRQLKIRKAEYYLHNGQKSEAKIIIERLLLEEDLSIMNKQVVQEIMEKS